MTPGQRRAARRATTAGMAAAVTWGITGMPGKAMLRGSLGLTVAAVLGALTVQARMASSKALSVENRLDAHVAACAAAVNFVANGGTITGSVSVTGDVHVDGTLWGTAGTLTIGDATHITAGLTADSTITTHTDFRGSTTTGDGGQGAAGTTYNQGAFQATINRVNDILAAIG